MDDETGWDEVLVQAWGPSVRAAVAEAVERMFCTRRGLLATTVLDPEDAAADWVQAVHDAVVIAIRIETGADIEELGSQAAWATYDEVWVDLARRARADPSLVTVPEARVGQVLALLSELPPAAVHHAGGVLWPDGLAAPVVVDGSPRIHVDGVFRWLATDEEAGESHHALARALIAVVRDDPLVG